MKGFNSQKTIKTQQKDKHENLDEEYQKNL